MKFLIKLATILTLSACGPSGQVRTDNDEALLKAKSEIERLEAENTALLSQAQANRAVPQAEKKKAPAPTLDMDEDYDDVEATTKAPNRQLCWQDYCPCDNPETPLDSTICRNARGGIEMSDDQWSIGAQARDMKRSGDRANREMEQIISEMPARRY